MVEEPASNYIIYDRGAKNQIVPNYLKNTLSFYKLLIRSVILYILCFLQTARGLANR